MEKELFSLIDLYKKQHPKAQSPLDYWQSFGTVKLIEIIKKADEKKIVFKKEEGHDQTTYFFE